MTDEDHSVEVGVSGAQDPFGETKEVTGLPARQPDPPPPLSRVEAIGGMLRPVAEPAQIMEAQEQTREFIEKALKPKRDYDTIPGTNKPTLLKPGAERTAAAFGCHAKFSIMEQEVDHDRTNTYVKRSWAWGQAKGEKIWTEDAGESQGLYRYVVFCELIHRASNFAVGSGLGSCSTMETKYIDRPRDLENTVLKMAKKRAFIDAVLTTFGLSEQFTQDTEDMPREHFEKAGQTPQGFSLDSPAKGKKNQGKTWLEVCKNDPDFVAWAIGRKSNFEGMDILTDAHRKVLSDELDRLAEGGATEQQDQPSGDPPPADQPADEDYQAHLEALRANVISTGKHEGKTWLEVAQVDFTYLDKARGFPWGRKMLEDAELNKAVAWACGGGLDRVRLEPTPEAKENPFDAFLRMTSIEGVTRAMVVALAKVHPGLPDDWDGWFEADYQTAVDAFVKAEDKGGALYVLQKAENALKAQEALKSPSGEVAAIPEAMTKEADAVLEKAEARGIDCIDWVRGFILARSRGDVKAFEEQLDALRAAYLAKAAEKPDPGQGSIL